MQLRQCLMCLEKRQHFSKFHTKLQQVRFKRKNLEKSGVKFLSFQQVFLEPFHRPAHPTFKFCHCSLSHLLILLLRHGKMKMISPPSRRSWANCHRDAIWCSDYVMRYYHNSCDFLTCKWVRSTSRKYEASTKLSILIMHPECISDESSFSRTNHNSYSHLLPKQPSSLPGSNVIQDRDNITVGFQRRFAVIVIIRVKWMLNRNHRTDGRLNGQDSYPSWLSM